MKYGLYIIILAIAAVMAGAAQAAGPDGDATAGAEAAGTDEDGLIRDGRDVTLGQFRWVARLLVVFADSPDDPRFIEQMSNIRDRPEALRLRDVVVLTDTDPAARGPLRQELRPRGFTLVLIGKDGTILLRKPFPWSIREISNNIDKLPARQREMREGDSGGS